ncbi:RHS repeat-associated core domain-containing protein [Paludibaculum fermentans]|uniref:RHS repeat-associated core domain-containing protein n=1 Tax=Paludibaculum fermentans TaxID=1473598 RepID=UPI003EBFA69C
MQTTASATNRLNGAGFGYDSNGNMTGWSTPSGSVTASYDIENRMTQIVTPSVTETYKYGPGNLRVKKLQGGNWTYTVYGQGGEVLGTYSVCTVSGATFLCQAKLRVYFGGRLVLNGWTGAKPDRLGSPDGTHGRVYPYGEVSGSVSVDQDETFTTYKRDIYTGLDYAQNRYYASSWGRFTTADPYRASGGPTDPQSWNRYTYVGNEPVGFMDPAGLQMMALDVVNTTCFYVNGEYDSCSLVTTTYWIQTFSGGGGYGVGGVEMAGWSGGAGGDGENNYRTAQAKAESAPEKEYPKLTKEQCDVLRTVLEREAQYGTRKAAQMSTNPGGDGLLEPFNSSYVPNIQTPVGELDVIWYTDLQARGYGFQPVVYAFAKSAWSVTRLVRGLPIGNIAPFTDRGEKTAIFASWLGGGYKDVFTPEYMASACP